MAFLEIEHKYLVDGELPLATFQERCLGLGPLKSSEHRVEDHYYAVGERRDYVYRYRRDDELQQLSVKSYGAGVETRLEVNLELDQTHGDQRAAVEAFLDTFGVRWHGAIKKHIYVHYFEDAEVVYYYAAAADRRVSCVEIEAKQVSDQVAALTTLRRYEEALGFDAKARCRKSLFDLLFSQPTP